jgi:hypothetical protein
LCSRVLLKKAVHTPYEMSVLEHTAISGNFPTVTRVLLSKIPEKDGKMSYVYDKCVQRDAVFVSRAHALHKQSRVSLCGSRRDDFPMHGR